MKIKKIDGKSRNPQNELQGLLKKNFPEIFAEGKVDCQKLKRTLGEDVEANGERYGLSWAGKGDCFRHIQEPTTKTLKPAKSESVDFENTGNLFIEGENLEVLKVLQKSYYGKIKAIYIDPPYNTGNDSFIYPDRFQESQDEYLKRIGDKDEEGNLTKEGMFRKNSKDSGHYHSNWLSMMYPRLFLARNLLRQDGVIFVSIDDNEVHNLRMIMNEVFGEENFRNTIFVSRVKKNIQERETAKTLNEGVGYILCYSRGELAGIVPPKRAQKRDERWHAFDAPGIRSTMEYDLLGQKPPAGRHWMFEQSKALEMVKSGDLRLSKTGKPQYRLKANDYVKLDTNWTDILESDSTWIKNGGKNPTLIRRLLEVANDENGLVLDFFAGSGTTAHAIMAQNAEDGGNRKFICVQLAEACDEESDDFKAGFKTIADIAKERIRRASANIKEEVDELQTMRNANQKFDFGKDKEMEIKYDSDFGFKVFKLDDSNFKVWNGSVKDPEELEKQMLEFVDNVRKESTAENMLYELLLKSGLDPNVSVEKKKANGGGYYSVDEGKLIVHLEGKISKELVEAILKAKPEKMVCLDRAFGGNDQLKTNTALSMESAKIDFRVV